MTVPLNIIAVVGARPNFVKVASLASAFREFPQVDFKILHTGQHYDVLLDEVFFTQLDIPAPFIHLGIGSDTPVRQLARMLPGLEQAYLTGAPDLVIVVGDTSSTLAGALAASKMNIPLAHVEAGLRSGDRSMPEEINRQLTDNLSDFLFVTEQAGMDNLDSEGFPENRVFFTGNCMVDTLVKFREKALGTPLPAGLPTENYVLMTLHRPSNVDTQDGLEALVQMLAVVSREAPVIFPVHPRTRRQLEAYGLKPRLEASGRVFLIDPQGYLEFIHLMMRAAIVITDSGGIQEETTFLGVPCLTLRTSTERPVTITSGTNELLPVPDHETAKAKVLQALAGLWKKGTVPPLWDGQCGRRITEILVNKLPVHR